jgi:RNA polymerase sigma factor (TIGR02999 family)
MLEIKPEEITEKLRAWADKGDEDLLNNLVPMVYDELHRQAHRYLRRERTGHTLQTTALVNEAYLKLVEQRNVSWESRTHFFAIAAHLMRRILIDYAKTKHRVKRGGIRDEIPFEEALTICISETTFDLLELDEVLTRFAEIDEQQAKIVELRYFSGLSIEETAEVLKISIATVKRDWVSAKAWLYRELAK